MRLAALLPSFAAVALLALSGCGYVHFGQLPTQTATVVGDDKLLKENSDLRLEKKMLQQELALSRAQGDALRSTIENRTSDGDTSRRLTDKLSETTRELAELRANYAKLQSERLQTPGTTPEEVASLKAHLGTMEEQLASSLRNYTDLQAEIAKLHTEVDAKRAENATLAEQVKTITAHDEQTQAALAQINTELLAQKESRAKAEQDATTLRTELQAADAKITALSQQRTSAAVEAKSLAASGPAPAGGAGDNTELGAQLDVLRKKVWALEAERNDLQQRLADVDHNAKKPGAIDTASADTKALHEENDALAAANADLVKTQTSLQAELDQAKAKMTSLTEENTRLKTRLTALGGSGPAPAPGVTATFSTSVAASTAAANGVRYHIVAAGDTLSKISTQYYGTPARWSDILTANHDVLGDDNNLVIGRTLRIPQ